ncbi:MAG: hypothetical protein KGJ80_05340 [Chloroflexota bacterium]|nr:hypothetical protein [Chloroflexota bacterium]
MIRPLKWLVPLALSFLALGGSACEYLESPAGITKVVMERQVQGTPFEPAGISDNFPPDQSEFHAVVSLTNAPKDSLVKAVWYAVDVGAASPPDTQIDETEVKTEGTHNLDFSLKRAGNQWPPGLYKVEIYWNGKLDRTLNFVVTGTPQRVGTAALSGCPPATTQPHQVSGWISQVIMAENTRGEEKEPVNRTGEFLPNETVHAVVTLKDAPPNTKFRAVFFAVDAGGSTICNAKLGESEFVAGGAKNLDFTLKPSANWALGKYRVDLYVNDALDHTANYVVVTQKSVH